MLLYFAVVAFMGYVDGNRFAPIYPARVAKVVAFMGYVDGNTQEDAIEEAKATS